jgi:hypothetical protein
MFAAAPSPPKAPISFHHLEIWARRPKDEACGCDRVSLVLFSPLPIQQSSLYQLLAKRSFITKNLLNHFSGATELEFGQE